MNMGLVGATVHGYHVPWALNTISQESLQKSYKEYFYPSLTNKEADIQGPFLKWWYSENIGDTQFLHFILGAQI